MRRKGARWPGRTYDGRWRPIGRWRPSLVVEGMDTPHPHTRSMRDPEQGALADAMPTWDDRMTVALELAHSDPDAAVLAFAALLSERI